jgi:hypothetical protein
MVARKSLWAFGEHIMELFFIALALTAGAGIVFFCS